MNSIDTDWKYCYQPDIENMFQVDENRILKGLGWHKIIMISEHRAPFTDELIRFDKQIDEYVVPLQKKVKVIWRRSMEW